MRGGTPRRSPILVAWAPVDGEADARRRLSRQVQHQGTDRAHGTRSVWALRPGHLREPTSDQVAVPTQHRVRAHQQSPPPYDVQGRPVQQRHWERPIARSEPHLPRAELALQRRDLMAHGEDLHVLAPIAHRQQAQRGERVYHAEVGQSQQRDRSSCCCVNRLPRENADSSGLGRHPRHPPYPAPTRADEVFGKGKVSPVSRVLCSDREDT